MEQYTVNVIGDGLLRAQFLTPEFKIAKKKVIDYFKKYQEEFWEDGYVKVLKFDGTNEEGTDMLSIGFDEEIEEMDIDIYE
jgi:hypothetical protein